jgi:hypothetical protein
LSSNTHQFTGSVSITGSAAALLSVNNNVLYVSSSGNVLIGTTTGDNYKLQIVGSNQATSTFGQTYAGVAAYSQWISSSNAFVMGFDGAAGATARMTITGAGNVGIGTTSPGLNLSVQGLYGLPTTSGAQTNGILRVQDSSSNISLDMGVIQHFGNWIQSINKVNSSNLILALNPNGGNVGIGTSSPICNLDVVGAIYAGYFNLRLADTTAMAANVGGGIALSGRYTTAGDTTDFGFIKGMKENGTSGDYGGYINFYTRPAAGNFAERMRINSNGHVTTPAQPSFLAASNQ